MFLEIILGSEDHLAELAFHRIRVELHMGLEMILRGDFLVADAASVDRDFDAMEATVPDQQLLVDKALLAVLVRTLERLVAGMRRHMNVQADFIGEFLIAEAANVFLGRFQMPSHVLVVRVLRHVNVAETTSEHLRIFGELKFAFVSLVVLQTRERQTAVFAVTNVEDAEINFRPSPFLVEASMLRNPSVSRVLLSTSLTNVAMRV